MFRKTRITLALLFWVGVTMLFLDFTGTAQTYLGWMAKVQFLPAVLATHVAVVAALLVLTLIMGRVYCSIICPMGVMQDVIAWVSKRPMFRKNKKAKLANRYSYSPEKRWLRLVVLVAFIALLAAGCNAIAILVAPYSAYGRIASNLMSPAYIWVNNVLAAMAEHYDSYAFYSVENWFRGLASLGIALGTLVIIGILAWKGGRTWCNTICPVGTVLGYLSRFSLLRMHIHTDKCNSCGLCARNCKASCINPETHQVDLTRCVQCGDCLEVCHTGAMQFGTFHKNTPSKQETAEGDGISRRQFVSLVALTTATAALKAEEKTVDGGLATIEDKVVPERKAPLTPPGSQSARNFYQHCTGCQLCITQCPNGVLRPSSSLEHLMQPEMQYERGYCRPECTRCSEACPAGAIRPISVEEKTSIQIGHAVWVSKNCLPTAEGVNCGNCAKHCPTGSIQMVHPDGDESKPKIPVINTETCIGCGACENLCPARPFSAIYVEGHETHREI